MRRVSKVLISTAGALLIAPLAVASQALPASAATGNLLVTTLGHTGVARSSQVIAWNISQGGQFQGNSGTAFSVPDGQYAVIAGIDDNNTVETLAEAIVTVTGTGTTKVTLDGRQGKLVKVTLNGTAVTDWLDARVCAGGLAAEVEGYQPGGALYVVPSSSRVFSSSYIAVGNGAVISGYVASGVPSNLGGAWTTSGLAKLSLTVRSGEEVPSSTLFVLQPQGTSNGNCQADLWGPVTNQEAPYRSSTLVSPGLWDVRTDDQPLATGGAGGYDVDRTFVAGHSYSSTYYAAAWSPHGSLAELRPGAIDFSEPVFADPGGNGFQSAEKYALALGLNGHTIATRNTTDYGNGPADFYVNTKAAGWYTLTADVTRYYPGVSFSGVLSPRATLAWRFYANPGAVTGPFFPLAAGFMVSFTPQQLTLKNQASPGTQKTVAIKPFRPVNYDGPTPADSVTKVQVWASADDGTTWQALAVQHSTSGWTVAVTTPASGFVSLRAEVTGSHGDTSTETVYRAYAVS